MLSAPTSTAPAPSRRRTNAASLRAGALSRSILEPANVAMPEMSNRFLTANGTPSNGSSRVRSPLAEASEASTCDARRSALACTTSVNALMRLSVAAMRSRLACTSATALTSLARTASAIEDASLARNAAGFIALAPSGSRART